MLCLTDTKAFKWLTAESKEFFLNSFLYQFHMVASNMEKINKQIKILFILFEYWNMN